MSEEAAAAQVDTNAAAADAAPVAATTTPDVPALGITATPTPDATQTTSEADGKSILQQAADATAPVPETAPAEYTEFNFPENMEVDRGLLGVFAPVAKDLNLSQEKAQQLVTVYADHIQSEIAAYEKTQADARMAQRKEIESIPNYKESILVPVDRALTLATAEDRQHIEQHYADDPAIVRVLAKVGQLMGEGKSPDGDPPPPALAKGLESQYKTM